MIVGEREGIEMLVRAAREAKLISSNREKWILEEVQRGRTPEEALLDTGIPRPKLEELSVEAAVSPEGKLSALFSILSYNQSILQFADDKANTLIVINSIFLASGGGLFKEFKGVELAVAVLFFIVTTIAIAKCLMVVKPRTDEEIERLIARDSGTPLSYYKYKQNRKPDFIFFADIVSYPRGIFVSKLKSVTLGELYEQLAYRLYKVSKIASLKYRILNSAQSYTLMAAMLWLITMGLLIKSYIGL